MRICFVCLGNICRSPTAEGVFRKLVIDAELDGKLTIDSAGTGAWHLGELPDRRSREAAARRGYELNHRARKFTVADFDEFDLVLAMDRDNYETLIRLARGRTQVPMIKMLRSFESDAAIASPGFAGARSTPGGSAESIDAEVPDPWYGEADGFEEVLDICERACRGLLEHVRSRV